jgi:iron complex transport system ATP-binding protein
MKPLSVQDLSVRYGMRTVLHQVSLQLPANCWTCLVGPNGAGKSTLLAALAGLPCGDAAGQSATLKPAREQARERAWLGQSDAPLLDLTVRNVVATGRFPHVGWWADFSAQDELAIDQALLALRISHLQTRAMGALSGGERQRVLLARAMAVQAPVLLMDEPLTHLDPPHQALCLQIIRQRVAQGCTVVTVLHDIHLALQAQHLVVLQHGRVVGHGATDSPMVHRALEQVFEGCLDIRQLDDQWVALPRFAPIPPG